MTRFEAPTSRMMPVSRRRVNAESRIVVATSSTAQTSVSPAITQARHLSPLSSGEELVEQLALVLHLLDARRGPGTRWPRRRTAPGRSA